jgi:DNA-binding NarL/FixJ family response regulator
VRTIAVTSFLEEGKIRGALEAGASGYLLKDAEADDVASAIPRVAAGDVHLQPEVASELARSLRRPAQPVVTLTPREREVVRLVAEGRTNQQIAAALGGSERTARAYVSNILTKLGLTSRTQAAVWAREHM